MGLMEDSRGELVSRIAELVKEISRLPECKNICKRMHGDLVRRIKLLSSLFEELKDGSEEFDEEEIRGFEMLKIALDSSKELLQSVNGGSKLYQVICLVVVFCLVAGKEEGKFTAFGF